MDGDIPQKRCSNCPEGDQWHPATPEFFTRNGSRLCSICKVCKHKKDKAYRERPEVHEHKLANDRINNKVYYRSHAEQERERQQVFRNQPDGREYRQSWGRGYRKRPEVHMQVRANSRNRHARKRSVKGINTPTQVQEQLKRQKHKCYYAACGFAKFEKRADGTYIYHVEHTYPIARVVGSDIPANDMGYLVLACPTCNMKKHDKFPWEFPEGGRLL